MSRNKQLLETTEHIIAYLDILGASELIFKNENSINIIESAYTHALKITENRIEKDISNIPAPKIKIFSDNIVIACPISDDIQRAFKSVAISTMNFQLELCHHGQLVRGGITKGKFAITENMVWGKGLVDAYELESKVAYYPRVTLSRNLVEDLSDSKLLPYDHYTRIGNPVQIQKNNCMKSLLLSYCDRDDNDFTFFLNYLLMTSDNSIASFFKRSIESIQICTNNKIYPKLLWHYNYLYKKLCPDVRREIIAKLFQNEEKSNEK